MHIIKDAIALLILGANLAQSRANHKHLRVIRAHVAPEPAKQTRVIRRTTNHVPKMDSAPIGARFYDESFGRAPDSVLKANGYGVVRYMSHDPSKDITPKEAAAFLRDGLRILLVWETTSARALDGFQAGQADAREFLARSHALGYHGPLFFTVDHDYPVNMVQAYFRGVVSVVGPRAGTYGGYAIIEARMTNWLWQTAAWSQGRVSPQAHLYQRVTETHPVLGTDENVVLRPINCWARP